MTPAQNTKIESVVEGVESLSNAIVALHAAPNGPKRAGAFDNVQNARKELRDALAEFLKPALRVVGDIRKAS